MKTTFILFFAVILNACSASNQMSNTTMETKENVQETLNGTFNVSKIGNKIITNKLTISFDSKTNTLSGFSGCNRFFGSYTVNKNTIVFNGIGSTKKMCENDKNKVESHMMSALEKTTHFKIKDNQLMLLSDKIELLTAAKTSEMEKEQSNVTIRYRAHTRGSLTIIVLDNKTVSVQKSFDVEPEAKSCSDEDWNKLMDLVSAFNLKSMSTLEAPSKAFQYDGAAIANFKITKDEETYSVPSFDAGNPNKEIAELIEMVLKIAEKSKE